MQQLIAENLSINACKQKAWNQAILLSSISIIILLISYWSTLYEIIDIWIYSDTFQHGFIIFPMVIYLLWLNREKNRSIFPQSSIFGVVILFAFTIVWLTGFASNLALLRHLSFIAMIPVILWSYFGGKFIKNNIFPLGYLFFAVPMGEFLVPLLQDVTATITVYLLRLSNIPVVLEGRYFYIPSGSFEVAKACSGIRYLIASLAIGSLYAYLMYTSFRRRLLFIILMVLVPIVANGMRAYGIVMLAHYSDYEYAVGFDHLIYGWIFFGGVIFILFWLGSFFREPVKIIDKDKDEIIIEDKFSSRKRYYFTFLTVISILMLPALILSWVSGRDYDISYKSLSTPVLSHEGWAVVYDNTDIWQPHFNGATQEQRIAYIKDGRKVEVYLAYYRKQEQDKEMINAANKFYDKEKFFRKNEYTKNFNFVNGLILSVRVTEMTSKINARIMYNWYLIGKTPVLNPLYAKILEAKDMFFDKNRGSLVVAISSEVVKTGEDSIRLLDEFMTDFYPLLLEDISLENKNEVE